MFQHKPIRQLQDEGIQNDDFPVKEQKDMLNSSMSTINMDDSLSKNLAEELPTGINPISLKKRIKDSGNYALTATTTGPTTTGSLTPRGGMILTHESTLPLHDWVPNRARSNSLGASEPIQGSKKVEDWLHSLDNLDNADTSAEMPIPEPLPTKSVHFLQKPQQDALNLPSFAFGRGVSPSDLLPLSKANQDQSSDSSSSSFSDLNDQEFNELQQVLAMSLREARERERLAVDHGGQGESWHSHDHHHPEQYHPQSRQSELISAVALMSRGGGGGKKQESKIRLADEYDEDEALAQALEASRREFEEKALGIVSSDDFMDEEEEEEEIEGDEVEGRVDEEPRWKGKERSHY